MRAPARGTGMLPAFAQNFRYCVVKSMLTCAKLTAWDSHLSA